MANLSVLFKIGADISDLQAKSSQVVQALDSMEKNSVKATSALNTLGGIAKTAFAQFTIANLATDAIRGVISEYQRFITEGQKITGLTRSFEQLSKAAGQNSREMMTALQTATRGMVSDYNLLQSANKAMLLGLPVTAESMGDLAKTATILGKAMGQDATKSLDDLIVALGRSSPLILDNLGLSVKLGEANEAYATKLGKSVGALTDAEKKMAFYEAAMEAARKKVNEIGEGHKTFSETVTSVWTSVGNRISNGASQMNEGFGNVLASKERFIQFLKDANREGFATAVQMANLAEQTDKANRSIRNAGTFGKDVSLGIVPAAQTATQQVEQLRQKVEGLTKAQKDEIAAARVLGDDALKKVMEAYKLNDAHLKVLDTTTKDHTKSLKTLAQDASAMVDRVQAAAKSHHDNDLALRKSTMALQDQIRSNRELNELLPQTVTQYTTWHERIEQNRESLIKLANVVGGEFGAAQDRAHEVIQHAAEALRRQRDEMLGLISTFGQFASEIGGSWGNAIADMVGGWLDGAAAAEAYEQATTRAGKAMAAMQGAMAVWHATASESKLGAIGGGALAGASAGSMFGPWGTAIGAAAGALTGFFRTMNDGRDLVKGFVADQFGSFDALHAKLNELGADGERLWISLTQNVGRGNVAQAQSAIAAIESAFAAHARVQADAVAASEMAANQVRIANEMAIGNVTKSINGLTSQYNSLWESIKDEAPEEVMGIVESNTRERMRAIESQREDAVENLKGLTESLGVGFDTILEKLDTFISRLGAIKSVTIPVELDFPDGRGFPETTGHDPGQGFASGTPMLDFASFGRRTVTALHGDEAVIPRGRVGEFAAQLAAALGGSMGGVDVHVTVDVDGNVLDRRIEKKARRMAAMGMLQPLAAAGRSY